MSLLKYISRFKRIHELIKKESTGTPKEFASKLGISRSMLMIDLQEMKELGAEIDFCKIRRSYHYRIEFTVLIKSENTEPSKRINFEKK